MTNTDLIRSFQQKVSKEVAIEPLGVDGYVVYTPFTFDDGDHFVVLMKREADGWYLTDNGHTLMHLSYGDVDISTGARKRFVEESLTLHGVEDRSGESRLSIPGEDFGEALYSYLQAIGRVATVTQWHQERVASTFSDDLQELLRSLIPENRAAFHWFDSAKDPDKNYVADCRINGRAKPCFVFGVGSDARCSHATICCLTYEKWAMQFQSIVFFEDQTKISRKPLAQLSNVAGKQFPSLGDRDRIAAYFAEILESR